MMAPVVFMDRLFWPSVVFRVSGHIAGLFCLALWRMSSDLGGYCIESVDS